MRLVLASPLLSSNAGEVRVNPDHRGRQGREAGAEYGHRERSVVPQDGCGPKTNAWGRLVALHLTWCLWALTHTEPPRGGFSKDESSEEFKKSD